MRHLDLFSGIGGFALAARWMGWETVAFCEREKYARRVLEQHWPGVPIIDDITQWPNKRIGCDIITGGFPCQPFSSAGLKRGKQDDRFLWPAMLAVIERERPAWVVGENVAGIIHMALDQVLSDLETINYTARPLVIPACAVDAPHRRDRVWIVGHSNIARQSDGAIYDETSIMQNVGGNPNSYGAVQEWSFPKQKLNAPRNCQKISPRWPVEPPVGRVANGIPNRTHRIKGLGNAIVPQVAFEIFSHLEALSQSKNDYALRKPCGRAVEVAAHNLRKP